MQRAGVGTQARFMSASCLGRGELRKNLESYVRCLTGYPEQHPLLRTRGQKPRKSSDSTQTYISPSRNMLRFVGGKFKTFKGLSLNKSSGKMPSPHLNLRKVSTNFSLIMCHCQGL